MRLPDDVQRHVARCFAPEQQAEALRMLAEARIEDGSPATPRLLRCAAFASRGNLPELHRLVALLALDWRDVIVAGEYELQGTSLVPVRNFSQPLEPLHIDGLENG